MLRKNTQKVGARNWSLYFCPRDPPVCSLARPHPPESMLSPSVIRPSFRCLSIRRATPVKPPIDETSSTPYAYGQNFEANIPFFSLSTAKVLVFRVQREKAREDEG